jgi:hypothetical protein
MSLDHIHDTVKVGASVAAPGLHFLGVSVEEWTFVLSAVVSILFIIEKMPMLITRLKGFIRWIKKVKTN